MFKTENGERVPVTVDKFVKTVIEKPILIEYFSICALIFSYIVYSIFCINIGIKAYTEEIKYYEEIEKDPRENKFTKEDCINLRDLNISRYAFGYFVLNIVGGLIWYFSHKDQKRKGKDLTTLFFVIGAGCWFGWFLSYNVLMQYKVEKQYKCDVFF